MLTAESGTELQHCCEAHLTVVGGGAIRPFATEICCSVSTIRSMSRQGKGVTTKPADSLSPSLSTSSRSEHPATHSGVTHSFIELFSTTLSLRTFVWHTRGDFSVSIGNAKTKNTVFLRWLAGKTASGLRRSSEVGDSGRNSAYRFWWALFAVLFLAFQLLLVTSWRTEKKYIVLYQIP